MVASGQHLQHPAGFLGIGGLAQDPIVHDDSCVRAQHRSAGIPALDRAGFCQREARDVLGRRLRPFYAFVDLHWDDVEGEPGGGEQIGTPGGRGRQDEPHGVNDTLLRRMEPLQHALPAVLADILRRVPLSPEKVSFAWRTAVGPAFARVSAARLSADGVVEVQCGDEHWRREIRRSAPVIRERLAALLGADVVKTVKVVKK